MNEIKIIYPNDYQRLAIETNLYDDVRDITLGLSSETGEVDGKVCKVFRDKKGFFNNTDRDGLKAELGDVLWHIAALSNFFGFSLQSVMEENIQKLQDRAARGVLHGSGDNR